MGGEGMSVQEVGGLGGLLAQEGGWEEAKLLSHDTQPNLGCMAGNGVTRVGVPQSGRSPRHPLPR